jgi:hypothetical protein
VGWLPPQQQLRQLGDVGGDAPGVVVGGQVSRRAPTGLVLEVEVTERLPVGIADDEALCVLVDGPRRRGVARCGVI